MDRYHGAAGRSAEKTAAAGGHHWMRASELIGKDVDDRQGKDAGEVKDVVVNMAQQRVHYAVMDYDQKGTPVDKLVAVPLGALGVPADKDKDLVLQVPREKLETKLAFSDKAWPDLNDPAYRRDVGGWLEHFPATSRSQEQGR